MSRRKSAGFSASPLGSVCPGRPLHHPISSLNLDHRSPGVPPAPSSCPIPPVGFQLSPSISPTLPAPSSRTLWSHSPSQFNSTLLKHGTFYLHNVYHLPMMVLLGPGPTQKEIHMGVTPSRSSGNLCIPTPY